MGCNQEYASHGMFLNFAGEAYIGRNHDEGNLDIPLVAVSPLARACNETEIVYQPATNFLCLKRLYLFLRYLCPKLVAAVVPAVAPRTTTLLWKVHTLPLPWVELVPPLWDASLSLPWLLA